MHLRAELSRPVKKNICASAVGVVGGEEGTGVSVVAWRSVGGVVGGRQGVELRRRSDQRRPREGCVGAEGSMLVYVAIFVWVMEDGHEMGCVGRRKNVVCRRRGFVACEVIVGGRRRRRKRGRGMHVRIFALGYAAGAGAGRDGGG